jgi:glycosyl transferase family 25
MSKLQILVISLKNSKDRQSKVISEMKKTTLDWEFLDAVDGTELDLASSGYHASKVKRLLGFELTSREVGCYLSHMQAWRACIKMNQPTLVFEDDFLLQAHFEDVLATLTNKFQNWEIVRLQALSDCSKKIVLDFGAYQLVDNLEDPLGATAYLVNPASATILLQHSAEIYEPLDHYLEHQEKHGLKMLSITPYPVTVIDPTRETSTITDRPERSSIRGFQKLARSFSRTIDRNFSKNPYFPK